MKKWKDNYLMMMHMLFLNLCLIWKEEENYLKRIKLKNKKNLKNLLYKVKMLEGKSKLSNKEKWKTMILIH